MTPHLFVRLTLLLAGLTALHIPLFAQCAGTVVRASDATSLDEFGHAVALDGTALIVGANLDGDIAGQAGSAYLFDLTTGLETFKVTAQDAASGDRFGSAVAVAGSVAVATSPFDDDNGVDSGSAYLIDVGTGTESFKLVPSDGAADDLFGSAASISGAVVVVGSPFDDDNGTDSGAVYLFDATTGAETMKLTPSDGAAFDLFGSAVAIDGNTILVAAPLDDDAGANSGSVYVFDAVTGAELTKLTASDGAPGDGFGNAVAVSGMTGVIGARLDGDNGPESGSAYLFDVAAGTETAKLVPSDGVAFAEFGFAVDVNGGQVVVGARLDDAGANGAGSVYVFDAATGAFTAKLVAGDGLANDEYGTSVAFDGSTIVTGAPGDDDGGLSAGSTYVIDSTALQRFPGTSEDLALETTINQSGLPSFPCKDASVGDLAIIRLLSPNTTLDLTPPLLLAQIFQPSNPPSPVFPGIAVDLTLPSAPVVLVGSTPNAVFTQTVLPPGGIPLAAFLPPQLSGVRVLFQGYAFTGIAANGSFASTESHVLNVL